MQFTVCRGVVFSLAILDEVYVNKKLGGGASGPPANCKLVTPFSTALDFFVSFFIKKKRKPKLRTRLRSRLRLKGSLPRLPRNKVIFDNVGKPL
jgi:hypothetical protein